MAIEGNLGKRLSQLAEMKQQSLLGGVSDGSSNNMIAEN